MFVHINFIDSNKDSPEGVFRDYSKLCGVIHKKHKITDNYENALMGYIKEWLTWAIEIEHGDSEELIKNVVYFLNQLYGNNQKMGHTLTCTKYTQNQPNTETG